MSRPCPWPTEPGGRRPAAGASLRARPWLALALLATTGCYTHRPVVTPAPGTWINAHLSEGGSDSLRGVLGPEVTEVNGRVVAAGSDTLRVSVMSVVNQRGIPSSWRGELVPLPRTQVSSIGQRRLAPGSTALLGAGLVGALYLLYRVMGGPALIEASGGGGGGGPR